MCKLVKWVRNCVVFSKNLHSWQKFYTTAGRDGRNKFQLCWAIVQKLYSHFIYIFFKLTPLFTVNHSVKNVGNRNCFTSGEGVRRGTTESWRKSWRHFHPDGHQLWREGYQVGGQSRLISPSLQWNKLHRQEFVQVCIKDQKLVDLLSPQFQT